jgi:ATP-dependent Clp protease ATP-binding subunit ClpA
VAVLHRNNYIGTEHVLYGLLADDNTATAALAALAVPTIQLRGMLEKRLGLGASLAAERIAWTPYARRAAALAKDIATDHGSTQVRCDHFLVGLVQLGRGVASELLAAAGISEDDLRDQMKPTSKTAKSRATPRRR